MAASRFPADAPLYFVTDHALTGGRPQLDVIRAVCEGGVRLIQYRDKVSRERDFLREAGEALAICRRYGAKMLINDRVEAAKDIGADGVHLGQDDMEPQDARDMLGEEAIIGLSTHNRKELLEAADKPVDYVNIGPMFPTATKDHSQYGALGTDAVLELSRLTPHPFTTMGGIKRHHLPDLFRRGVRTVAMVTEISLAPDIAGRVRELLTEIDAARNGSR
jgi:thiamine-phosphate pyrophosphorylase